MNKKYFLKTLKYTNMYYLIAKLNDKSKTEFDFIDFTLQKKYMQNKAKIFIG